MRLSIPVTFAGIGSLGASAHLYSYGEFAAAAVLGVGGVLALAFVAWVHGLRPPARLRSTSRRAAAPAFAALLVLSVVASGPAVGALGFQGCSLTDSLTGAVLSSIVSPNADGECRFNPLDGTEDEHTDVYARAASANQSAGTYLLAQENFGKDRRQIAWGEGKVTLVNEMNANASLSNASAAANESMAAYYSAPYHNILQQYSAHVSQVEYDWKNNQSWFTVLYSVDLEVAGFATYRIDLKGLENDTTFRTPVYHNTASDQYLVLVPNRVDGLDLAEGSDFNVSQAEDIYVPAAGNDTAGESWGVTYNVNSPGVTPPPDETSSRLYMDNGRYQSALSEITTQNTQMQVQMGTYADEVYSTYTAGEISTSDVLSPAEIAGRASTDYSSTGYYSFTALELAALGYSGDFNSSVSLEWERNGTTTNHTGTLFYTADDVSAFENGTTYNATSLNGTLILAEQADANHSQVRYMDRGDVTITSLTNPNTGASMNATTMETYTYDTANASALQEELEKLSALRKELEQAQTGSGGGIGIDIGGTGTGVIVALGAVVALFILKD